MFIQKNDKKIALASILISILLNAVSYFFLPSSLIMQIRSDGSAGTTLPTLWGLVIMFAINAILIVKMISSNDARDKQKSLIISVVILIINVITIIFNLK